MRNRKNDITQGWRVLQSLISPSKGNEKKEVITTHGIRSWSLIQLRTQNSPALCDVVLSVSQLFVPHFAMSAFACIFTISYNRPNKQPDPSFEFLSILLTFGRLKQ